ncbi:MAG TPA: hypothetical protein DHW63_07875 [Hyphomonadaceae bacterium]|nr:hypothetical protein [Hyphomonadaceae bacterium]
MTILRSAVALALAAALGACANLSAEAPLFSVADQIGPSPLVEGVWIALGENCPERNLSRRRFPQECSPIEIDRLPDGAWRARYRVDLATGLTREERERAEADAARIMRLIVVPAVERQDSEAYAPLYVAESAPQSADDRVSYYVIVPQGTLPAESILLLSGIGCADALREGPIAGVTEQYTERVDELGVAHQDLTGCVASSQAAVREAARRAVIENLATLFNTRYARVARR